MPNVNDEAKAWEEDLSGRVGEAVQRRRMALGLSAAELAEKTVKLGYPIHRVAISKIENNRRAGKLDVAELLVLARALAIPPVLLLFPDYPFGSTRLLPNVTEESFKAAEWVSGRRAFPAQYNSEGALVIERSNPGLELVEAATDSVDMRSETLAALLKAGGSGSASDERMAKLIFERALVAEQKVAASRAELWGENDG